MCRSQAQGGRRCRGSNLAVRRATYAVKSSASSKVLNKALADGELDQDSEAYRAYERAHSAVLRTRMQAKDGDHDGAAESALEAKNDMNRAAQLLKARAARRAEQQARVKETNEQIDQTLEDLNPNYQPHDLAYSHNCSSVVQAYELARRGHAVKAGPIEPGRKGRPASAIEDTWGVKFTWAKSSSAKTDAGDGGQAEIEQAFKEPGSRGIVAVNWKVGGGHVFNVENVDGKVRFVDAQPTPHETDASHYFKRSSAAFYMRLDDRPTPPSSATARFLEA
ncbi:toxin glutamine deamidase domain-containing protein [Streptomyces europaeiscabiei]|uniref:toxin glutamine deamidase domain-containing protein n=1 Tax=Streptomyces europaeiscabiei TaxID=146819 RepID=UPI0029AB2A73|nr:toxin glutamine deamidase domain-containing protein [Streptomyces europaeiscabiei]MDX3697823.1 toxin glutamine deamidase domain-containing protein [Streptomyces europaeiscabiei]